MQKKTWIKVMSAAFAVILMVGLFATTSSAQAAGSVDALAKGHKSKSKAEFSLEKSLWDNLMTSAEKATGLDKDALRAALDGHSLADVLHSKNVDVAAVEATAKSDTRAAIDQLVADGKLTQKRADKIKSRIDSVTDKLVNKVRHAHKNVTPNATQQPTVQPTAAS